MTDFAKKTRIPVLITTLSLSLCAVVLRAVLLLVGYEPSLGHFVPGVWSELFFPLIFVLALAIFSFYAFLLREVKIQEPEADGVPTLFSAAFGIVATVVWLITFIPYLLSLRERQSFSASPILYLLGALLCLSALLLIAFFVFRIYHVGQPAVYPVTAFGAVIFCLLYAFFAYFDSAFTLNSPIKIFDQITFVALALFFLLTCRRTIGRDSIALRLPLSLFCMILTAADSLPNLIYAGVTGKPVFHSVLHDFLVFALFLFVTATALPLLAALKETSTADTVSPSALTETDLPLLPDDPSDYEIPTEDLIRLAEARGDAPFDATAQGTSEFDPTLR